jgi:hypothetical protein
MDVFVSSSETGTEEEMTHPIGRDRAKTVTWKGKGKGKTHVHYKEVRHLIY